MILSHHQCQDYITEKFFNILQYNVIPGEEMMVSQMVYLTWLSIYACSVVLNGANMSLVAPPHSYIRVEDFSSVIIFEKYILIAYEFIKIKLN